MGLSWQWRWGRPDADGSARRASMSIVKATFPDVCVIGILGVYSKQI